MSRIVLVNQSSTPDDAGSGNAQLFIEGNELYQQVGTGDKSKVVNQTTSTFTNALSSPSVSAINTCKAWVNWAGDTDAIKSSYNISSVADGGTGIYTVTYAQPMLENDYVVMGTVLQSVKGNISITSMTSASCIVHAREAHSDTLTNYGADGIVVYAK